MLIHIAKDFSAYPAGRFPSDGPFSGERFREEVLIPALQSGEQVTVVLAGTKGYGSSFLEEAFGGLVRYGYFRASDLERRLKIEAGERPYEVYRRKAISYISTAVFGEDRDKRPQKAVA